MKKLAMMMMTVLMVLASCSKNNDGYTITGTIEGAQDGDTVYLAQMQGFFAFVPLDSTVVKGGKFEFKGSQEGADLRFIVASHDGQPLGMAQIILENAPISVKIFKEEGKPAEVKGGQSQTLFSEYEAEINKMNEAITPVWEKSQDSTITAEEKAKLEEQLQAAQMNQVKYMKKFILDHNPSAISDMLFAYNASAMEEADVNEVLEAMKQKNSTFPFYKQILKEKEAAAKTDVGQQYTDIAMKGIDGKDMKVSDYVAKNEYTLIDFWASWCGPCRAEMPHVVKAYNQFHSKGFEVVGVSLDNDEKAWKAAVESLKLPWPQMSDLKGWECEGAALYNVKSIPANVLVDKSGKIVAKDLRGEDLLNKLAELIK